MKCIYKSCPGGQLFSWIIGPLLAALMASCGGVQRHKVVFHFIGGFNRHFVIERVALNEEKAVILDSGAGRGGRDSFVYTLPASEPTIFRIRLQGKIFQLPFIYDSSDMAVYYNYTTGEYHFVNSPASEEWQRFQQGQLALAFRERALASRPGDSTAAAIDSLIRESFRRNFNFADTVTNPALFLLAYNLVDFDRDYGGLEHFVLRAGRRFPTHSGVQTLIKNTLEFVRTFRTPLKIGDTLPRLRLPDTSGREVSIGPIRGKFLLIDFWSTWCDQCRVFSDAKKKARAQADTSRLAMVSIAVDAEKDSWMKVVRYERYRWTQLIDEKMWAGQAVKTFHFDSIPFNYLVGPDGRILAKGISADSLLWVLSAAKILRQK